MLVSDAIDGVDIDDTCEDIERRSHPKLAILPNTRQAPEEINAVLVIKGVELILLMDFDRKAFLMLHVGRQVTAFFFWLVAGRWICMN